MERNHGYRVEVLNPGAGSYDGIEGKKMLIQEPQTTPKLDHREGPIARTIEQQTAKLPSDIFLMAAFGSIAASLIFQATGKKETANFIGHWAPTILILGLYNKIVKLNGSDNA